MNVVVQLTPEDARAWHQVAKAAGTSQHITAARVFRLGLEAAGATPPGEPPAAAAPEPARKPRKKGGKK